MTTIRRKVSLQRQTHGRIAIAVPAAAPQPLAGRIPRISRLMALAIELDQLLREGKVRDQSELARLAHVTQPRMSQIMNLNLLAPDIQEELLHLPRILVGKSAVTERHLRPIAAEVDWRLQRARWSRLRSKFPE